MAQKLVYTEGSLIISPDNSGNLDISMDYVHENNEIETITETLTKEEAFELSKYLQRVINML